MPRKREYSLWWIFVVVVVLLSYSWGEAALFNVECEPFCEQPLCNSDGSSDNSL